jgi:hypothetical protein
MRNLRVLKGQRKAPCSAAIVGFEAQDLKVHFEQLEPSLKVQYTFGSVSELLPVAGLRLDCVVVSQPYHILSGNLGLRQQLEAIRNILHPQDGTLGMLWSRPLLTKQPTTVSFHQELLRPLLQDEQPLTWMESEIGPTVELAGFLPLKHRKFRSSGSVSCRSNPLFERYLSDSRSLQAVPEPSDYLQVEPGAIEFDLHAFHSAFRLS